jgi:hypothetical protein
MMVYNSEYSPEWELPSPDSIPTLFPGDATPPSSPSYVPPGDTPPPLINEKLVGFLNLFNCLLIKNNKNILIYLIDLLILELYKFQH